MPAPLSGFHPAVRRWFTATHGTPTPPQELGWPSIAEGRHTLILAPTGSGKTLAAFLWTVNHLVEEHLTGRSDRGVRVLYVSPLKALNNDIARNLREPLSGIRAAAQDLGLSFPPLTAAVRTGDTPAAERSAMLRRPPDILITTPESLYLMLTSPRARGMFRTVRYVIVDEIHSLAGNKRGVHLSLSLERLVEITETDPVRIGLSATQRPLERIALFLGGWTREGDRNVPRPVAVIDAGRRKQMDLQVRCAVPDLAQLPPGGIWPGVFTTLLDLILRHRTTLVFVNNRRLAERVATALNDLATGETTPVNLRAVPAGGRGEEPAAAPPLVQAYHGSMSRTAREGMEEQLKNGALRALVATSSLELGIDIGGIDLVVQLQSPRGIARGLQRIGRSGHLIAATSLGRIFPTHAADLEEAAVVARAMADHDVEATTPPSLCLDVLAQQIVAMVSVEDWEEERLLQVVRRSSCYADLSERHFTSVLRMLTGRADGALLQHLRPRISRDTVHGILRALPGSSRIAITSGGTISDRGTFGIYLEDGTTRVGEADEEFVFESRPGDTFILGSSVWRMVEIDAQRVVVRPAPGEPARMPFWRGEGIGRTPELGGRVGAFRREVSAWIEEGDALRRIMQHTPVDPHAAWNIQEYYRRQREITGDLPHDRLLIVEGFRDEIGDPRIVVHSPWGRRVNGLLAIVLERRLQSLTGVRPQTLYNDDGVLLRSPHSGELPPDLMNGITPAEAEAVILEDLPASPLFAGQFRRNAARALLFPKTAPGKRTPLWLQRLRSADLLAAAAGTPEFPIIVETAREVLHDILDIGAFLGMVDGIARGEIGIRTLVTETPSPFAAGLLFDFLQVYMYEPDRSPDDAGAEVAALSRESIPGFPEPAAEGIMRAEAMALVEARLQHTAEGYRARTPEELCEILISVGPLTTGEVMARCEGDGMGMLAALAADGRALAMRIAGEDRWVAAEEEEIHRHPEEDENARRMLTRYLLGRGPVSGRDAARRLGLEPARTSALLEGLCATDPALRRLPGHLFAYRHTLERMQRTSLGILRKEIEPASLEVFTAFQLQWQHVAPHAALRGDDAVGRCLEQLQGLDLPAELWEREIIGRRVRGEAGGRLRLLTSAGDVLWAGTGGGRLRQFLRGSGEAFLPATGDESAASLPHGAELVYTTLQTRGALFFQDLRAETGLALAALNRALAHLVWTGLITNDTLDELLRLERAGPGRDAELSARIEILAPHHNPRRAALMQTARKAIRNVPGWSGRWAILRTAGVLGRAITEEERARLQALQLLRRYGVLPREAHRREEFLPWARIAGQLHLMELRGEVRKGYFVRGISGMQYALPEAAEMIRAAAASPIRDELTLLNACDPANPFGPGLEPTTGSISPERWARTPSTSLVFRGGTPLLWCGSRGARITCSEEAADRDVREAVKLFLAHLDASPSPPPRLTIEYWNSVRPTECSRSGVLRELGFRGDRQQMMTRERPV